MPLSQEHEALGQLILSPAWEGIIKATIASKVKVLYDKLIDPDVHRQERLPDDYIRGYIAACKWMLVFPHEEMNRAVALLDPANAPREVIPLFGERKSNG